MALKIDHFDQFMTTEGTKTLILALTSKTGQSIEYKALIIFIWIFLSERGYLKAFYKLNFRLQTYRVLETELNKSEFLNFFIDFSYTQPAQVLGNADLLYQLSRINQTTQHISCRVTM